MAKLAPLLSTNADELLGLAGSTKKLTPTALDPTIFRRLRAIEELTPGDKRQLLQLIDAFVAHGRRKRRN